MRFAWKLVSLRERLVSEKYPRSNGLSFDYDDMLGSLSRLDWSNTWDDANMAAVRRYLFGAKDLKLPKEVRELLPDFI